MVAAGEGVSPDGPDASIATLSFANPLDLEQLDGLSYPGELSRAEAGELELSPNQPVGGLATNDLAGRGGTSHTDGHVPRVRHLGAAVLDFDRDGPVELRVVAEVHRAEAARSQGAPHRVAAEGGRGGLLRGRCVRRTRREVRGQIRLTPRPRFADRRVPKRRIRLHGDIARGFVWVELPRWAGRTMTQSRNLNSNRSGIVEVTHVDSPLRSGRALRLRPATFGLPHRSNRNDAHEGIRSR